MELKFEDMKRAELQRWAKKAGIKANMKTGELIKALVVHHSQANPADEVTESIVEEHVPAANPDKVDSEPTNETKPQRVKKGRGRGRKKTPPAESEPENEPTEPAVTDTAPEIDAESKSNAEKTGRRGQRSRKKRTSAVKKPLETVKTPKSAQKRSHSDIEEEAAELLLPPAKQQRVSPPSQGLKKDAPEVLTEPAVPPPTRKSTRKRTFSMSPKSEGKEKESQSEQGITRVDEETSAETGAKRSSSRSKKETTETEALKTSPKKTVPPTKKTGIPLPKIKASSENVTPGKSLNFKKAHKAQFEKLESIDDYLERKRKRIEALTQSYRKAPSCSKKTPKRAQNAVTPKDDSKPIVKRTSFFSPKPSKQTAKTVTFHASRLKTPAKPSTFNFGKTSTEKRIATPGTRKSIAVISGSVSRKSMTGSSTTPFKFTGTSVKTPSSNKKAFDLKASLEKTLSYKPYTGKLKPLSEIQPIEAKPGSHIAKAKENLKKPKLTGRQGRQRAATKHRAQSRKDKVMARRGLSMA